MSALLYRQYLAMTALEKRVEALGGQLDPYTIFDTSDFWRNRAAADPDNAEYRLNLMEFPEVQARLQLSMGDDDERRAFGQKLQAAYPDFVPFRDTISEALWFEPLDGIGVKLHLRVI